MDSRVAALEAEMETLKKTVAIGQEATRCLLSCLEGSITRIAFRLQHVETFIQQQLKINAKAQAEERPHKKRRLTPVPEELAEAAVLEN